LRIVDAANTADFLLIMRPEAMSFDGCRTVIVRNIEALQEWQQEAMIEMVAARFRTAAPPPWRLITAASAALSSRVAAGTFAPRLFYLLNSIHIDVC
jgi:hypothetical protein